jgi:rubrerythrin
MSGNREIGRQYACVGKRRYSTRKAARKARNGTEAKGHLNIYRCSFCGFLHLGHLPPDVRRGETDKDAWKRRRGTP